MNAAEFAVIMSFCCEPKISGVNATITGNAPSRCVRRIRSTTSSMMPAPVPPAIDPTINVNGAGAFVPGGTLTPSF